MDFAKKILEKCGWKEGEGLGRQKNGIAKPIKVKLKFDKKGLGDNRSENDFNNCWWDHVFNEAANNIDVTVQNNGVAIDVKNTYDKESPKITKKPLTKVSKKEVGLQIDFVPSSTAAVSCTEFKPLTDEELFKACGSRTAHKGARHGLKMNGKLQRLKKQELLWLNKNSEDIDGDEINEKLVTKKLSKKRRKHTSALDNGNEIFNKKMRNNCET